MSRRVYIMWASLMLLASALCTAVTPAQESQNPPVVPDTNTNKTNAASGSSSQDAQSTDSDAKPAAYGPTAQDIRAIGSSTPLPTYDTLLRWGPVYVRSMEVFQSYDRIFGATGATTGIFNQDSFNATVLRTDIVYDHPTKLGRLVIEYAPRLTVVNGHVGADFVNQTLGLNFVQPLSPRWTLGLSDTFSYYSVRNLYGDYFLDVNTLTGATVPSSVLDSGGSWLNAGTQASFSYALSPTSSISIAPGFAYSRTTGLLNGPQATNGYQYSGTISWSKRLSPNFSLQADYGYRLVQSLGTRVPYENGDVGFSWQLGRYTTLGINAGMIAAGFTGNTDWAVSGSAQIAEKVGRSTFSIGYYRGVALFNEVGTQGISQVAQANYRVDLTQRLYWTASAGYESSLEKNVTDLSARFASAEVGYRISRQVDCFASYGYRIQSGGEPLLAGRISSLIGGIRWSARPVQ